MDVSRLAWPVMSTTSELDRSSASLNRSMPLPSGSRRSSSTMSGAWSASCLRASSKLQAVATVRPSLAINALSDVAESISSSTIRA
ncbi:hypothetical protein D9M68_967030 [compost metagenome]